MGRFLILFLMISFASVGAIFYTPALPRITDDLQVSDSMAQLTVMFFLAAYAVGQLPYGALGNCIGRKRSVYLGSFIAVIGSLLCALSHGIWMLTAGRIITAIGMASGMSITFTIVGDLYSRQKARRVISALLPSFTLLPAVGIAISGFLTTSFGWRSCFYALAAYSLVVGYLASRLPATGPHLPEIRLLPALRRMVRQFRNSLVVMGGLFIGCGTMMIYVYSVQAPFIAIDRLGLTAQEFGLLNFFGFAGYILGAIISTFLPKEVSPRQLLVGGLTLITLFAALMTLCFALGWIYTWSLFLLPSLLFFGIPFSYSTVTSWVTSSADDKSSASSLMSFLNITIAALGVFLFSYVIPNIPLTMPLFFLLGALLMVIAATFLWRHA